MTDDEGRMKWRGHETWYRVVGVPHVEEPEAFLDAVEAFLRSVD
jgi:hypothetical protein